jgi:predicted AlkP superfamily phosphohydrolase/phosphomutase
MLGVDGIDWVLMNEWIDAGRLPILRELFRESHTLFMGEPNRLLPGSVWTDIATGASAGIHGFVHDHQLRAGTYETHKINASVVSVPPFYRTLSEAGVRCAVVDFPVDYPQPGFNGLQVIDWGTEFKLWRFETEPHGLEARLIERYGDHPLNDWGSTRTSLPWLLKMRGALREGTQIKKRLAIDLLEQREHDFIFVNFAELHKAGHFYWKFHDRRHPDFTDAEPGLLDAMREAYENMDAALGEVLRHLRPGDDLILLTDRGMYADYRGDHLVDDILLRLGLAQGGGKDTDEARKNSLRSRVLASQDVRTVYFRFSRRFVPKALRTALRPLHRAVIGAAAPLDWSKTQVFRLPSVGNTYLRVNLEGREPQGTVAPGAAYEALLAALEKRFRSIVNPLTEEPAVEHVYFPARTFKGPRAMELPDVAVMWKSVAPINALFVPDVGLFRGQQQDRRSGNHRPEGFALFRTASMASGTGVDEGDARQVTPAVLAHFGVAPPAHYELDVPRFMKPQPRAA